jgi:hypothetical protein
VSVNFFASFPQKSVTLAFEHGVAEAFGKFLLRRLGFGEQVFP